MREDLKNNIKNKIGKRNIMKCGEECEIIEYRNCDDMTVRFLNTGELTRSTYQQFKNGSIKSHFTPTVYGVGIVGLEETKINGRQTKSYNTWHSMLRRYYDSKYQKKYPTYIGCTVCEEWLYYKNFKDWFYQNYYEIDNQQMALDKDILVKGNKIYSPENCTFVPERVNTLFIKKDANRGSLPIGVCYKKQNKKYQAYCSIFDMKSNKRKTRNLGYYSTPEEAFNIYKQFKEKYIKEIADHYKDRVPSHLYNAMYNYKIEIDD